MKNLVNHISLGGDIVDKKSLPQRKTNKTMSGEELLHKAAYGKHKPLTEAERHKQAWERIAK